MRATLIQIGKSYEVKAGRNRTTVKVESFNRKTGGWVCETKAGKSISIRDAARIVREIVSKKSATPVKPAKFKTVTKTSTSTLWYNAETSFLVTTFPAPNFHFADCEHLIYRRS